MSLRPPAGLTRRSVIQLGLGALAAFGQTFGRATRARAAAAPGRLYLQPLGGALPDEDVALVRLALGAMIGMETHLLPRVELPASAFYPPRRRYRAEKLLDFLDGRLPPDGTRILGLTGVDISTTKGRFADWGLLGLGRIGGASSVISEFRCRMRTRGRRRSMRASAWPRWPSTKPATRSGSSIARRAAA